MRESLAKAVPLEAMLRWVVPKSRLIETGFSQQRIKLLIGDERFRESQVLSAKISADQQKSDLLVDLRNKRRDLLEELRKSGYTEIELFAAVLVNRGFAKIDR